MLLKTKLLLVFFGLALFVNGCGSKPNDEKPIESIDPDLKERAALIADDIIVSFSHQDKARFLLDKYYATPKLHTMVMRYLMDYNQAYTYMEVILGEVSGYKLAKVKEKDEMKTFYYTLKASSKNLTSAYLEIRLNLNNDLVYYNVVANSKDGMLKSENLLPTYK